VRRALIIIAKTGYQDQEYAGTRAGLQAANFEIVIGSTEAGECLGKLGGTETADTALRDVEVADYDRVAYIGGPGAHSLKDEPEALRIAQEAVAARKPLGAICIAPTILAAAGVLHGKKATVWNGDGEQNAFLQSHGASYTGELVTVDGLIVTGNGPVAADAFGKALAEL
jgi:protease I